MQLCIAASVTVRSVTVQGVSCACNYAVALLADAQRAAAAEAAAEAEQRHEAALRSQAAQGMAAGFMKLSLSSKVCMKHVARCCGADCSRCC